MKLIDANDLFKRTCNTSLYDNQDEDVFLGLILDGKEIDPVHAAGGCHCKECLHSELVEYEDNKRWVTPIDEYWCNEHKNTMPLNGFCSEGRIKNDVTQKD